jgi:hypothetical protein
VNPRIKLLLYDEAELPSSLTQTDVFAVCRQRDLCGLLISNVWICFGHILRNETVQFAFHQREQQDLLDVQHKTEH